jgi:hypothetical protein
MATLKAVAQDGRLIMDTPTDLPDGTVVELAEVRASLADKPLDLADEMSTQELARFKAELKVSLEQTRNGELIPAEEVLSEL